ncbi:MAG: hypothetical protein ABIH83_04165 [Candidatus Micrarchaeota archaeon]
MAIEFWNELLTKESWEKLVQFSKEYDFILIGGWAAYLWTHAHKSKDIDIIVDLNTLNELKSKYDVSKNERMKKYEIKFEKFDIDIYLPFYSSLAIPAEDLQKYATKIEGIKTLKPEALLILKQGAEIERRESIKGKKDSIDILTLLIHSEIDFKEYSKLLKKYKLQNYASELKHVIANFNDKDIEYLGIDFVKYKKFRKKMLERLKKLQ